MHFCLDTGLVPSAVIVPPDSSLVSLVSSPSTFMPRLKPSQWALPATRLGSIPPLRQMGSICSHHARCSINCPTVKRKKKKKNNRIPAVAPASQPCIIRCIFLGLSIPPCHWRDRGEHHLHLEGPYLPVLISSHEFSVHHIFSLCSFEKRDRCIAVLSCSLLWNLHKSQYPEAQLFTRTQMNLSKILFVSNNNKKNCTCYI